MWIGVCSVGVGRGLFSRRCGSVFVQLEVWVSVCSVGGVGRGLFSRRCGSVLFSRRCGSGFV